jgi:carbon storage regulator
VWVVAAREDPVGLPTLAGGGCAQEVAVLVLARTEGQTVVLDDRIVVTVLDCRDGLVRLGIDAPRDVGVRRGELGRFTLPAEVVVSGPEEPVVPG